MRTANPALNKNTFTQHYHGNQAMTLDGTVTKTALYLLLLVVVSAYTWFNLAAFAEYVFVALIASVIIGLVVAMVTIFKKEWAPVTAPVYAVVEGVILGVLSLLFESMYPGIVFQAVLLTFGVFFLLLVAYRTKAIQATENFKLGVFAATGAIMLIYLVSFVCSLFGFNIPYIHESGPIGIIFSIVVVVVAALNLILDFDFIEKGVESGAPKYMESYAAFGLLVTLIWLYIEILRLLSKIRDR